MKCTVRIYKDGFTPSRPWQADVTWDNGDVWKAWSHGFKTKKSLVAHVNAQYPGIVREITF